MYLLSVLFFNTHSFLYYFAGYIIRYRLEGGEWQDEAVEPGEASHVLQKLRCGSTYHLQVAARNLVGHGKASRTVKTRTRGAGTWWWWWW